MRHNPELVVGCVTELEARGRSYDRGHITPKAVSVDALGIPELDRGVCVEGQTCEDRIFGVTEHAGPFYAEYASCKSLVTVLVDLSHELELSRQA